MKDNNLIAEFMGFKQPHPEFPNTTYWYKELPNGRLETLAILNYHISWDWLMPVVQKIESLGYVFTIQGGKAEFGEMISKPQCFTSKDKISSTYDAVVEFIKQHNKEES